MGAGGAAALGRRNLSVLGQAGGDPAALGTPTIGGDVWGEPGLDVAMLAEPSVCPSTQEMSVRGGERRGQPGPPAPSLGSAQERGWGQRGAPPFPPPPPRFRGLLQPRGSPEPPHVPT